MQVSAPGFGAISRADGNLCSGRKYFLGSLNNRVAFFLATDAMGLRQVLQKNTNFYAAGIDVVVRPSCRSSLIGLGFPQFRVRVFEIFDTQD